MVSIIYSSLFSEDLVLAFARKLISKFVFHFVFQHVIKVDFLRLVKFQVVALFLLGHGLVPLDSNLKYSINSLILYRFHDQELERVVCDTRCVSSIELFRTSENENCSLFTSCEIISDFCYFYFGEIELW